MTDYNEDYENDEPLESLSDYYKDIGQELQTVPGGPNPAEYSWDEEQRYFDDVENFREDIKNRERAAEIGDAAFQGVSEGIAAASDQGLRDLQMRQQVMKHASTEDRELIFEADALEREWDENEARLAQAYLEGNKDEIQAAESHRARISADLNAMPRQVPSVERARSAAGVQWKQNILGKWFNFSDSEKERYRADLREAIEWSNADDESDFMISLNPQTGDLFKVSCSPETSCREEIESLKQDERLKGVPEESIAYVAHQMGLVGPWHTIQKISPGKKRSREAEETQPQKDIVVDDEYGNSFEFSLEEERPKPEKEGPKPKTNIYSRL